MAWSQALAQCAGKLAGKVKPQSVQTGRMRQSSGPLLMLAKQFLMEQRMLTCCLKSL